MRPEYRSGLVRIGRAGALVSAFTAKGDLYVIFQIGVINPPRVSMGMKLRANAHWIFGFALAVVFTLTAFFVLRGQEDRAADIEFEAQASDRIEDLAASMHLSLDYLDALGAYFDATSQVDRALFQRLASPFLDDGSPISALEWVPRVPDAERAAVTAAARLDGFPAFEFTERDASGALIPAAKRPEYFPVYFLAPYRGNEAALGFDLWADSLRRAAMRRAIETRKPVATDRISLVQDSVKANGFLVFRPVFASTSRLAEHRSAPVRGFVLGVFRLDRLMAKDNAYHPAVRLVIFDNSAKGGPQLLYPGGESADISTVLSSPHRLTRTLTVANRTWTVVALPRSPALSTHHSASTATLVLGLLLSVLLAVYLRQKERRQALIEDTVRTRTHDLKQERNFNRAILDSAGVVVMVIDRKAEIIHFNLEAQRLTGCTAEEVVGKPFYWERFLPPDQRADVRVLFERFLAKDIPARLDMPWLDRSGKRHEFDWSTTLLLDDQMAPEYLVTVGIDMTDARKNAEALSRSEARFRQMFEHSNAVMLLIDAQTGGIFDANAAASQFYGWPHEALCHMNISQINRLTDEEVAAERQRAANESRRYFIFPHRLADGSVHTVEVHTTPIDIDGRKMLFSIVHDISERLAAEARVRQLVHEQSIMLDNTLVGIVRAQDRMITWANRAFENMLGYGHGALNGLSTRKLYQDEASYEQFGARAYTAIQVEGNYRGEVKLLRVDGRPIWCDVSGASLEVATGASLWIFLDITDKKRAEDEIRQLAYFDPLTQLPNRRLMTDRLNQALISSQRRGEYGAVMMLDMDQFKGLNDTLGHHMGDLLLQAVSRRLTACVRQQDTVARLGGDEYVVLLEGLGFEDAAAVTRAKQVAEKIRASLSAPYLLGLQNTEYHTTSSIGLTLFLGQENPVDVLLRHADLALYQAKDAGRNTVRFFSPAMQAEIETISAMEAAIRQGLARDEFILHYQPQVDQIGRLVGVEALIRWQSPELGQVPPTEFIPLAEETGLILELGQRVIDTACAQLKRWSENPLSRDLILSINVSARQFRQVDFVDRLRKSLSDHEANPARLILELTEGTVLKEVDVVVAQMRELTELGVGFSLDDFGTGYSSLSYLKRLPLTQVKIDKSFVRDLAVDPSDEAIVRAILAMSRSLGLQAIAEGVETAEQREFLSENGCVFYQGYLFGRPGPIEDIDRLIGEGTILL